MVIKGFSNEVGKAGGGKWRGVSGSGVGREIGNAEEDLEFDRGSSGMILREKGVSEGTGFGEVVVESGGVTRSRVGIGFARDRREGRGRLRHDKERKWMGKVRG